jgi:Fe-S-cluster containining protein
MNLSPIFSSYELLVDIADQTFRDMEKEYESAMRCKRHCADCCHAVFGLFIVEAAYLKQQFDQLSKEEQTAAFLRCNDAEKGLKRLQKMLLAHENDPHMQDYTMARQRIRCPLLDDHHNCVLYAHRPITCRVYGIPTRIQRKARVCGKSQFKKGENYPLFDLDKVYRDLYVLSNELLSVTGEKNLEKASLLISVSKAVTTPQKILLNENLE